MRCFMRRMYHLAVYGLPLFTIVARAILWSDHIDVQHGISVGAAYMPRILLVNIKNMKKVTICYKFANLVFWTVGPPTCPFVLYSVTDRL